jgi:hypothetical protein
MVTDILTDCAPRTTLDCASGRNHCASLQVAAKIDRRSAQVWLPQWGQTGLPSVCGQRRRRNGGGNQPPEGILLKTRYLLPAALLALAPLTATFAQDTGPNVKADSQRNQPRQNKAQPTRRSLARPAGRSLPEATAPSPVTAIPRIAQRPAGGAAVANRA